MEEVPVVFAAPRALRVLNVIAVATSLAACTSTAFMVLLRPHEWTWALVAGLPTVLCGALWALALRWRKTTKTGVRYGWLLSLPLASLNGALGGGAFLALDTSDRSAESAGAFVGGALLGGTFGVVVWLPALVVVLLVFGLPIARAQRMARAGIAGEERGELFVGAVSALLAVTALVLAYAARGDDKMYMPYVWASGAVAGRVALYLMSVVALVSGASAMWIARVRELRRRRFVARVEASEVPGFRVEKGIAGKVLLRVVSPPVPHYRVADVAEELFELDESGGVTHPVQTISRSQSA
jgi:hypothetical protein